MIKLATQTTQMELQLIMIFFIHDHLLVKILETDHNSDMVLKVINKDVSFPLINDNGTDSGSKLSNRPDFFHLVIRSRRKNRKS